MSRARVCIWCLLVGILMVGWIGRTSIWDRLSTREVEERHGHGQTTGGSGSIFDLSDPSSEHYRIRRETEPDKQARHGPYREVSQDGIVLKKGFYRDGKKHGRWSYRDWRGTLTERGSDEEDVRVGEWKVRLFDGYWTGELRGEVRVGFWEFHNDAGELEKRGEYVDGLQHGVWTFFHEGEIEQWTTFENGRRVPLSTRRPGESREP
ncbi:MAG: hypothetical protein AAF488_18140 [Planctomycetota bacterium]